MKLSERSRSFFDLVKGHSDFKVKLFDFGRYTQVSDSGPHGPLVELYLCFVVGHVPYKFQRNPISSIRHHNSWQNINVYLNAHHHINLYSLTEIQGIPS